MTKPNHCLIHNPNFVPEVLTANTQLLAPVRDLSKLFQRLLVTKLVAFYNDSQLRFLSDQARLAKPLAICRQYHAHIRQEEDSL